MLSLALILAQAIPITRVGLSCPLGYNIQSNYCAPSSHSRPKQAINLSGTTCPLGTYTFGNYCTNYSDDQ